MHALTRSLAAWLVCLTAWPALAQSPNTGTVIVLVKDQSGAAVPAAAVLFANTVTGDTRELLSGTDGAVTASALPVSGVYDITVAKAGFTDEVVRHVALRAGETARLRVRLIVSGGKSEVTVYGTTEGVRADPQLGVRLDAQQIDETPVLGRKVTSLPLLNAAFRSAKGTGDLFVNATYFVTGAGGRRQPAVTLDGATNDEPWGRQTMFATVPIGAVQELNVLSNAFSAEFGWTAGAAVNIVTKSGTNVVSGEALFLGRPGSLQKKNLPGEAWCAPSIPTCAAPRVNGTAPALAPADVPDALAQGSFAIGAPIVKDRTHVFVSGDYTHQDRTAPITTPLVPAGTTIVGRYRQGLVNARLDHKLTPSQSVMLRFNLDRFHDTNPQDAVSGSVLPGAGREFARHTFSMQGNETAVISGTLLNEARLEYLAGDPITQFEPLTPSTQFTRAGSVPFTSGESRYAHIFSRQTQLSDTLSWTRRRHYVRLGGSAAYSRSGGDGTEFGSAFVLGQFTVNAATTKPSANLGLTDMTRYTQSFNLGRGTYVETQWLLAAFAQDSYRLHDDLTLDLGLRYDSQTFSDARGNLAPRVGVAWNPAGDSKTVVRGGYGMYYTQLRSNLAANFELGGPEGVFSYTASPGQTGFPQSLAGTPVVFDQNAAKITLPARNITIRPGMRGYYTPVLGPTFAAIQDCENGAATAASGRPCYPDSLVNPRSQVASAGAEREIRKGLILSADYVHQHWTGLDRTVDLNAPSYFDRTAPGQVRTAAAADATRPIAPVNGGFRTINAIENLGVADYDALQTMVTYRGASRTFASFSYTLSKATNTTEPDGNGIGPNDFNRLGEEERGPSLLDQRHRAVITLSYRLPFEITAGTVTQLASARPFNSTTGVDNNGDGSNNDRPVIGGTVIGKSAFRGTATSDVSLFGEGRIKKSGKAVVLRVEVFNLLNHANVLGRLANYGDSATPNANFGQAAAGLANLDPARMFQFQVRFVF
jgi:hypothetical protein